MRRSSRLSQKISVTTLVIFAVSMTVICVAQRLLYLDSFKATLNQLQSGIVEVKRSAAEDLLREIRMGADRSLQPGEHQQFANFAAQQKELADIEEFSLIDEAGKVELSSKNDCVGKLIEPGQWEQVKQAKDTVMIEEAGTLTMYHPLRVDADLKRLSPNWQVGQFYGALKLVCSKEKVNQLVDGAQAAFKQSASHTLWIVIGIALAALVMSGLVVLFFVVRPVVGTLARIVTSLTDSSDRLVNVSGEIAQTSQKLADGASSQASSLEETSSALEEMSAMARNNAGHARSAEEVSGKACASAKQGDESMTALHRAMTEISEASARIQQITKVIEEIAFQTNLLALNAAVEAARAGEQGKGFAVVAEEVRNLAHRSSEAAKQIATLIENEVQRTEQGQKMTNAVGEVLGSINQGISQVSSLIEQITQASQEQANGVEQLNTAISTMDKVTQENVAGAEESSAAAQELAGQAQGIREIVSELAGLIGKQ